jgi:hypothetical protein
MSHLQLALSWDGTSGLAYCDGWSLPLPSKPRVLALDVDEVDYVTGGIVGNKMIKEVLGEWRPMTDEECVYVAEHLRRAKALGIGEIC